MITLNNVKQTSNPNPGKGLRCPCFRCTPKGTGKPLCRKGIPGYRRCPECKGMGGALLTPYGERIYITSRLLYQQGNPVTHWHICTCCTGTGRVKPGTLWYGVNGWGMVSYKRPLPPDPDNLNPNSELTELLHNAERWLGMLDTRIVA